MPELTATLTSWSHIRRSGEWSGQFGTVSVTRQDDQGKVVDALEVRQYHYETADPSEQEFAPYQSIVMAVNFSGNLYALPKTWLWSQTHLLGPGESDPHEFVGRDDRVQRDRRDPARADKTVYTIEEDTTISIPEVTEIGTEAVAAAVDAGEIQSSTGAARSKLISEILPLQMPVWAALSDALELLHRATGHVNPTRLAAIIRERNLGGDLRVTESELKRRVVQHLCDVCCRGKSTRNSHRGNLNFDGRLGSTFAYDLQGPFNAPSLVYENRYMMGIIEYSSRYVWPFFGQHKSDCYQFFQHWLDNDFTQLRGVYKDLGQVILVADQGESKSDKLRVLLAKHGIKQVFTSANTPEQNALIERVWRTLGEMATCMLTEAKLSEVFWEEARRYAVFIYNRLPPARKPPAGVT
jgi:hypothetical protein